ncbi:MAG: RNA-binding protein [Planctomycetes bacterium]|nr:RNA-binding protein [Planctomycetota bacterium]
MAKNLYVGGLSYDTTEDQLRQHFEQFGEVESAKVIMDRDTGRSKGFGFVEMATQEAAEAAIKQLDQSEFGGRNITVNEAREKKDRGPRY